MKKFIVITIILILALLLFTSCKDKENNVVENTEKKTKKECNYLYSTFVEIENKDVKMFGKDTLYEFEFFIKTQKDSISDTTICYKILSTNENLYNSVNVCDEMLVTIDNE